MNELLSQLFVYRYYSDPDHPDLKKEISYFKPKLPCFDTLMRRNNKCSIKIGDKSFIWNINPLTSRILVVNNPPIAIDRSLFVWASNLNKGKGFKLYTHPNFENNWMTSIPFPLNQEMNY